MSGGLGVLDVEWHVGESGEREGGDWSGRGNYRGWVEGRGRMDGSWRSKQNYRVNSKNTPNHSSFHSTSNANPLLPLIHHLYPPNRTTLPPYVPFPLFTSKRNSNPNNQKKEIEP